MLRASPWMTACLSLAFFAAPAAVRAAAKPHPAHVEPPQETGFLNRKIELHGLTYRFQVYLPEDWRRDDHKQWPIILFLHGRGERQLSGSSMVFELLHGIPRLRQLARGPSADG